MQEIRKDFYVYLHKDELGRVRYVGSGTGTRFRDKTPKLRSQDHVKNWDKLEKIIIEDGLTREQSRVREQYHIDLLWSSGILFNKLKRVATTHIIEYDEFSKYFCICTNSPTGLRRLVDVFAGRARNLIKAKAGDIAGYKSANSFYYSVKHRNTSYCVHRIVWALHNKQDVPTNMAVDHIDHDTTNNSVSNLRLVTQAENNKNKLRKKPTISGIKGVNWHPNGYWTAHWVENGKKRNVYFPPHRYYPDLTKDEANVLCKELAKSKRDEMVLLFPSEN